MSYRVAYTVEGEEGRRPPEDVTLMLVQQGGDLLIDGESGIFHLTAPDAFSWTDFARLAADFQLEPSRQSLELCVLCLDAEVPPGRQAPRRGQRIGLDNPLERGRPHPDAPTRRRLFELRAQGTGDAVHAHVPVVERHRVELRERREVLPVRLASRREQRPYPERLRRLAVRRGCKRRKPQRDYRSEPVHPGGALLADGRSDGGRMGSPAAGGTEAPVDGVRVAQHRRRTDGRPRAAQALVYDR